MRNCSAAGNYKNWKWNAKKESNTRFVRCATFLNWVFEISCMMQEHEMNFEFTGCPFEEAMCQFMKKLKCSVDRITSKSLFFSCTLSISIFEFCCCVCGIAVFLHSLVHRFQFYLNKFFLIDHYLVIFIALSAADAAILLAVHEWTTFVGCCVCGFFVNEQRQSFCVARREMEESKNNKRPKTKLQLPANRTIYFLFFPQKIQKKEWKKNCK